MTELAEKTSRRSLWDLLPRTRSALQQTFFSDKFGGGDPSQGSICERSAPSRAVACAETPCCASALPHLAAGDHPLGSAKAGWPRACICQAAVLLCCRRQVRRHHTRVGPERYFCFAERGFQCAPVMLSVTARPSREAGPDVRRCVGRRRAFCQRSGRPSCDLSAFRTWLMRHSRAVGKT